VKRFWLFGGPDYYPAGGMDDFLRRRLMASDTKIERITAFKASDGSLFADAQLAVGHQANLDLREKIESAVDAFYFHEILSSEIIDGVFEWLTDGSSASTVLCALDEIQRREVME